MSKTKNAVRSYNFRASIEGSLMPFGKISGVKSHWDVEPFQEGGRNNTEYKNKVVGKGNGQVTLSRMVTFSGMTKFKAGQQLNDDVVVDLIDYKGSPKKTFTFIGCTIMEINYGEFDAGQSNIVNEELVIEFQRMRAK